MPNKEQSSAIADALINQDQRQKAEAHNANAPPVPWLYRTPELSALDPWRRIELLRCAQANVRAKPAYLLAFLLTLAAFVWLALELPPFDTLPTLRPTYAIALFVLLSLGVQTFFIRREIHRLIPDWIEKHAAGGAL